MLNFFNEIFNSQVFISSKYLTNFYFFNFFLIFPFLLFLIGSAGVAFNGRNILVILMSFELMLLSSIILFLLVSLYKFEPSGQVYALFLLALAACESSMGLAILIVYFNCTNSILLSDIFLLRG